MLNKDKLWNKNFILLCRGQLISYFGDIIYSLDVRFWVLSITGSTALRGVISATAVLPRIYISPFARTFFDRHDRKNILITINSICGIATLILGIFEITNAAKLWMLVAVAITIGLSGCFFNLALLFSNT